MIGFVCVPVFGYMPVCVACFQQNEVGRTNTEAGLSSVVNTAGNLTVAIRDAQWLISMSQPISHLGLSIILIMCNPVMQIKEDKKYVSATLYVCNQEYERKTENKRDIDQSKRT